MATGRTAKHSFLGTWRIVETELWYVDDLDLMDPAAGMLSGLDIHYDLGEGRPLLGRRIPDLDLLTPNGQLRVFTLLHDARPVFSTLVSPAASTSRHGQIAFNRKNGAPACAPSPLWRSPRAGS